MFRARCWVAESAAGDVQFPYIGRVILPGEEQIPEDLGSVLRAVTPPDDAGAQTFDRFEWQAMMATVDLLSMYMNALITNQEPSGVIDCGLVCEYHEDWACVLHGEVELVSGKHKEPDFGAYTTAPALLGDGGVAHLFDRWHSLGGMPRSRLVTTAGVSDDAEAIRKACEHFAERGLDAALPNDTIQKAYTRLASKLKEKREAAGLDEIKDLDSAVLPKFLMTLTLQCGEPRRDFLPSGAPTAYAAPIAGELGRPDLAVAIWEAVLSLVRGRMRDAGPSRLGLLHSLAPGGPDELERRTVTVADAHVAITAALTTPGGFTPLPKLVVTNKMAVKMDEGHCAATSIDRAEALRKRFTSTRRDRRSNPGARENELELELFLRKIADRATGATRTTDGKPWGAKLWAEIEDRLDAEAGTGTATGFDTDMLLGGVADLANQCKIWFSEPFDAQARLRALRTRQS